MNRRQLLSVLMAATAIVSLSFGSAGFTAMSAERGVSVDVVPDSEAFVGYQSADQTAHPGDSVHLVTVENRFNRPIEVTDVAIDAGSFSFSDVNEPTLDAGQSATISGTIACEGGTAETVEVTLTLSGTGVWARIFGDTETREFEVTCEAPAPEPAIDGVDFKGGGTLAFEATAVSTTNVTYWTTTASANAAEVAVSGPTKKIDVDLSKTFRPQIGGGNGHVIAVYFPAFDVTYYHPSYDVENGSVGSWNGGAGQEYAGAPSFGG
ncbi:MAG: hypothetical protein ABEJ55_05175 [Halanaeroarchaeum sp.]